MDQETKLILYQLSDILNDNVDKLIEKRDAAQQQDKYLYRYICRKLENSVKSVNRAIDKIEASV